MIGETKIESETKVAMYVRRQTSDRSHPGQMGGSHYKGTTEDTAT